VVRMTIDLLMMVPEYVIEKGKDYFFS